MWPKKFLLMFFFLGLIFSPSILSAEIKTKDNKDKDTKTLMRRGWGDGALEKLKKFLETLGVGEKEEAEAEAEGGSGSGAEAVAATTNVPTFTMEPEGVECPPDWTVGPKGNKTCYYVPPDPQLSNFGSKNEAQSKCEQLAPGAKLVSIQSSEEQAWIEKLLADRGDSEWDFWTSGMMDESDYWHWDGSEQTIQQQGFVNWDVGQPNDPYWEKCLFIGHKSSFNHKWHDHRCSYRCSFICKWLPEAPVPAAVTCTKEDSVSYNENDYSETSEKNSDACEDSCIADERCKGYTFNIYTNKCYLKDKMENRLKNRQGISGICRTSSLVTESGSGQDDRDDEGIAYDDDYAYDEGYYEDQDSDYFNDGGSGAPP